MRACRQAAVGLFLLLTAVAPARAQEPPVRAGMDEAFLSFRYASSSLILSALHWQDSIYLPAVQLLQALQVAVEYDPAAQRLSGYYLRPEDSWIVDLIRRDGRIAGRSFTVPPHAAASDDGEVYMLPSLFDLLFGWKLNIDLGTLTVRLQTADTLPLQLRALRELARLPQPVPGLRPPAPLRYPRWPSLLRPGFAQYSVTSSIGNGYASGAYAVGAGVEAFGGDAQLSVDGAVSSDITAAPRVTGRWQLVRDDDDGIPVSQLRIGRGLYTTGLRPGAFTGVQLTNAPYQPRVQLGEFPLDGRTGPGWEVELYHNSQLIDVVTADADGRYRFSVPLTYGAALLTLRLYSPAGEIVTENVRLNVPVSFLPPGRTDYHIAAGAGAGDDGDGPIVQLRVEHGLTPWLTGFAGYERHEEGSRERFAGGYAGAGLRLPFGTVASVEGVPGAVLRARADAVFPSNARLSLGVADHARTSTLNELGLDRSAAMTAFVPFELRGLPLSLRMSGERLTYLDSGARTRGHDVDLGLHLTRWRPSIGVRRSSLHLDGQSVTLQDIVRASAAWSLDRLSIGGARLPPTIVNTAVSRDRARSRTQFIRVDAATALSRASRIQIGWQYAPEERRSTFDLRYARTTSLLHATAAVQASDGRTLFSQSARGTLGYDAGRGALITGPHDWVGRSGASLQLFLDHDGDGLRSADEPIIAARALEFRESVAYRLAADGTIVATDLVPYRRYSVRILADRVPNPLWMARDTAFSFIADPNGFKLVQVPMYVAGVLDGTVSADSAGGPGVAGIRVLVRDEAGGVVATTTSFSDGSFYYMGLPPGSYSVEVDSAHLRPAATTNGPIRFTVRATADGDFVSNVRLVIGTR